MCLIKVIISKFFILSFILFTSTVSEVKSFTDTSFSADIENETVWKVNVGGGLFIIDKPWRDVDPVTTMLPYIEASYGNWKFGVENLLAYHFNLNENASFFASLNYRDDSYDSNFSPLNKLSDHPVFNDYESPDGEVVIKLGTKLGLISFNTSRDISNKSDATTASVALDIPLYVNNRGVMLKAVASSHWFSEEYINYYYGINEYQTDNSVGRYYYQSSAATNHQWSINMVYPISQKWALVGNISRTKLDKNISNSPLIDENYQNNLMLVFSYKLQ
ncbi:MipA/OmpV family protein [Aliikangiella sp. IMCC44359]|uniref:MipA/OmpV family protein n=1 Tax=Aliikangiella sp. IMCC44359 TaxID=3459125 RepID=UPI00403ABAF0